MPRLTVHVVRCDVWCEEKLQDGPKKVTEEAFLLKNLLYT